MAEHKHHHNSEPTGFVHKHGSIDHSIAASERGIWAIKWSFIVLIITAIFQVFIFIISGSVALLADTIHNIGDAATAIPLWVAFTLVKWKPSRSFSYGYGRVEDLAGVIIVIIILFSALVAGYESINRLINPQSIKHLYSVIAASVIGFIGNEAVAIFRIKVGKEIGSTALIADGYHARVDGWTSLAVLLGAVGVWLGYPLADPIIGLLITGAILFIVWQSGKEVFSHLLDGVDQEIIEKIKQIVLTVDEVKQVAEVRARWLGHQLRAEVNIVLDSDITVEKGHNIAKKVNSQLLHNLPHLSTTMVHVDPLNEAGENHHNIIEHEDNN